MVESARCESALEELGLDIDIATVTKIRKIDLYASMSTWAQMVTHVPGYNNSPSVRKQFECFMHRQIFSEVQPEGPPEGPRT